MKPIRVVFLSQEINASLLMTTTREEFVARVSRGAALPSVLATVHAS